MTTYTTACGKRVVYVHHSCLLLPTADIELLCTYNWCVCVYAQVQGWHMSQCSKAGSANKDIVQKSYKNKIYK